MAQLTGDQIAQIIQNSDYLNRIKATLMLKAEYFKELTTGNRSDVNIRTQKRKRFAREIFSNNWLNHGNNLALAGQYWLSYYQTVTPVLDVNGMPTYNEIFNNFDPTYDFLSGYNQGDENETEIYW